MIKVAHIQFSMESGGRAALRLQRAFKNVPVESKIISLKPNAQGLFNVKYLSAGARLISRIDNKIQGYITRKSIKNLGLFSYPFLGSNVAKLPEVKNADIIYIHWALNGLLNFNSIKQIVSLNKPVIIFLHDMWAITGGCHHSFNCEKYKTQGCNSCPMFDSKIKNDLSAEKISRRWRAPIRYPPQFRR